MLLYGWVGQFVVGVGVGALLSKTSHAGRKGQTTGQHSANLTLASPARLEVLLSSWCEGGVARRRASSAFCSTFACSSSAFPERMKDVALSGPDAAVCCFVSVDSLWRGSWVGALLVVNRALQGETDQRTGQLLATNRAPASKAGSAAVFLPRRCGEAGALVSVLPQLRSTLRIREAADPGRPKDCHPLLLYGWVGGTVRSNWNALLVVRPAMQGDTPKTRAALNYLLGPRQQGSRCCCCLLAAAASW